MALNAAIVRLAAAHDLHAPLRERGIEVYGELPDQLSPGQCVLITDSVDAIEAARAKGLICLAIGPADHALRSAGARVVHRDLDDFLAHLDDALTAASPGSAMLTVELLESLMRRALEAARTGMETGEAPIGCVLARGDGSVIANGHNEQNATQNKTAHAEIVTFARAAGRTPLDARDLIMVSTLEPCVMCTGAAMEAAVDTIVYGLTAPADSGTTRVACPTSPESQMPRIIGHVLKDKSRALFEEWLRKDLPPQQRKFGEQLLKLT
jgi:tRNA(adenine34) deaminase